MTMDKKQIVLVPNQAPEFTGDWTVGEVLQMAQELERWVASLRVNQQPQPEPQPQHKPEGKE